MHDTGTSPPGPGHDAASAQTVEVFGVWTEPDGQEHTFDASLRLCPRFRPDLIAVLLHARPDVPTQVRVRDLRGVHTGEPEGALFRAGRSCDCVGSRSRPVAPSVTLCLTSNASLHLVAADGAGMQQHVMSCWHRALRRVVGTFF